MTARKSSAAKTKSSSAMKSSSSSKSMKTTKMVSNPRIETLSITQAMHMLETSYTLHLLLLLIMTVLSSLLLWVVVKQQYAIKSLDFQLRFMRERYEITKDRNGELLQKNNLNLNSDFILPYEAE